MPTASRIRWTTPLLFVLLLALTAPSAEAQCTQIGSISQWRCWEQPITSSVDFYAGNGNPYRDLTLRIHFASTSGENFDQDAYWDGDATHSLFRVRTALRVGSWTWSIASCSGTTGGKPCASGVTWTPSTGPITVTSSTSGPQIYARGFLKQFGFITPTTYTLSQLLYDDYSAFFWAADTAWAGPGKDAVAAPAAKVWNSYIGDRASKQFHGLLVAPAASTPPASVFVTQSGCIDPIPNSCSRPNPTFWTAFDNEILAANQQDLVPLIAGLVDPLNLGTLSVSGSYPKQANAIAFARYLAARMAGFAVLYSPGFDTSPVATTADAPAVALQQVMSAVGQAVHQADSRRLLTNHLSGNSTCTDYENLRSTGWMTFFLFQSGHALTSNGVPGTSCPGFLNTETAVNAATRRARQMPWTLYSSSAQPALPSYNGEGPYDQPDNDCKTTFGCATYDPNYAADIVDIRYHVRQAAYLSSLSGAYGFTYGVDPIGKWNSPMSYTGRPSAGDIGGVYTTFRTVSNLSAHPDWIANQAPDPNNDSKKMALASDGSSLVLAYVPAFRVQGVADMIQISTSALPSLGCSGWTFTWEHAQDLVPDTLPVSCTGANPITVTAPNPTIACTSNYRECDWVLQIKKTFSPSSMAQLAPSSPGLDIWADVSPGDGTSAIYARRAGTGLAPLLVSPSGLAFQQTPRLTRVPGGFLAVWHADGLDGSLLGVFAQRLGSNGQPVGPRLQVNTTTEEDQRDPALDSDPLGNTLVAWMSYGQDGDLGGIVGRLLDSTGNPVSAEFQINTTTAGHQERPQVAALPGGALVVAWQTRAMGSASGALSFRVFSNAGRSLTGEIRIPVSTGAFPRLVDLAATPAGGIRIRWGLDSPQGSSLGLYSQSFSSAGLPAGPSVTLP
jgi:hypothetical protein